jgi:tetratricopeptide (TPR) repeat protein
MTVSIAGYSMYGAWIEQRAGAVDAWESALRTGLRQLESFAEERAYRATLEAYLAHCLYQQGRLEEAQDFSRRARASSPPADLVNFLYADAVDAALAAHRGADEEALTLIGRAFDFGETTDFVADRAEVRLLYAEIQQLAGRTDEATELAVQALVLLEEKGDVTLAARARERLAALRIGTS